MTSIIRERMNKWIFKVGLLLLITMTVSAPGFATNFSDIENHWARSYIDTVSNYNVLTGYPDGSFKPDNTIKRIEFIAIIVNSQEIDLRTPTIGEYWGQPYVEAALNGGLINLNAYENFDEDTLEEMISREEMASIVVNAYHNSGGAIDPLAYKDAKSKLKDLDAVSPIYYENAIASIALNFISGYPDGTFAPKQYASRAEAAIISYRLLVRQGLLSTLDFSDTIHLSKDKLIQGDLLKISIDHATSPSQISLIQDLYPNFNWYESEGSLEGYLPTNYSTPPGEYSLKFTDAETGTSTTKTIEIIARGFKVQNLTVASGIESSTRTDEAYAEYYQYFNPSRETSAPKKYYTEAFVLPTSGRLSTEFGESRYVNDVLTNYRHAGIDIAAPQGSDVVAANRGEVVLAMPLILTGNSIVIDHGQGLFSVYFHLEAFFVEKDQIVDRAQLIGSVGSTGFSTGPHLHFTMSYYRFNIEPGSILYGQSITKENYVELMK